MHLKAQMLISIGFLEKKQDLINSPLVQNLLQLFCAFCQLLAFEPGESEVDKIIITIKTIIPSHAKVMHGNLTIVASLKALVAREPVSTIFINEDQSQSEIIEAEMCWRHQISLYLLSTWKICPLKTCWFLNPENASDNLPSRQLCSLGQLSRVSLAIVDTYHMSTYVPACITFTCTTTTTGIAS